MRDWEREKQDRVAFIRQTLEQAGAEGIVFGNSGGKDCALVGILCRMASENVLGVIMPCASQRNYGSDREDAQAVADRYTIATAVVDLTETRNTMLTAMEDAAALNAQAISNMAPRLRMTTLYAIAQSRKSLVAGTGNRSERYMGYFTKWGDGAFDLNPIADLTVREVYDFLRFLGAPESVIGKAPSAGLYEGQTDEMDMGISYEAIDRYLLEGEAETADKAVMERYHSISHHKRQSPPVYGSTTADRNTEA